MTKKLTILIIFLTTNIFGQTSPPKKVLDYIKSLSLKPLKQVDTTSVEIPHDFVIKSNWHVDYYARITTNEGPAQLDVYELIYNDSVFSSSWRPFNTRKKIEYDFMEVKDETPEFIYFGIKKTPTDEYLLIVSKAKDDLFFQFSNLLFKDIPNGIFVEYSTENCVESEMPLVLDIVNIKTVKYDRIRFSGYCTDINSCLNKFTYPNGQMTIMATLTKKKTKKTFTETKSYKI